MATAGPLHQQASVPDSLVELLTLPAPEAARRLALLRLEEWARTRPRLDEPTDAEALHDFRVALRRLRSLVRAFRPTSDHLVPRRLRRRLRRLADATSESRDLEVQRTWLVSRVPQLTARQRSEARWMLSRMERREAATNERLRRQIEKRYGPLHEQLWTALTRADHGAVRAEDVVVPCGEVVGARLTEWTEELEYRLGTIHAISDTAEAHAARMLVKRLRYLLESVPRELPGAEAAIGRLKQLQDILGDLHDRLRMALELREAFRDAAIRHARSAYQDLIPWGLLEPAADLPRAPSAAGGLAALALLLRAEGEALFAQLGTVWFEQGAATQLCVDLRALAGIAEGNRPAGIEIERKYLLSGLPPHALTCPSEEIEQGWLPGKELIERLRHVRSGAGDAWFRTVKSGRGLQRIEIEEAATRELFEALWPLTQGCRVRKRRYRVPQGALAWEVDEFLDRDLVLAEIELPTAETRVVPPEWLTGYLIREVTTEPEYVNRMLAR